jgi:hypothetical protein
MSSYRLYVEDLDDMMSMSFPEGIDIDEFTGSYYAIPEDKQNEFIKVMSENFHQMLVNFFEDVIPVEDEEGE